MDPWKLITKFDRAVSRWISDFLNKRSKAVGIDLGTVNTLICVKGKGVVLNEPSVVAHIVDSNVNVGYLYGSKAKMMIGKTPMKINVVAPLSDGVISDFHMAEEMIREFLTSVIGTNVVVRPIIIVGVPLDATSVEKRAIQETVERCGAREAFLVSESMVAAIGAKLPVDQPNGCMVIDVGGGTTEASIISLGGIVRGKSIRLGGNTMDIAITEYIRHKYNLLIGPATAEEIKRTIGAAYIKPSDIPRKMLVRGRDLRTRTPTEMTISEADVVTALSECVHGIIDLAKEVLELAPPELSSDIVDRGIVLCGGGVLIKNLDYIISEAVDLPVFVPLQPEMCVVNGIGIIVEDYRKFDYALFKQI